MPWNGVNIILNIQMPWNGVNIILNIQIEESRKMNPTSSHSLLESQISKYTFIPRPGLEIATDTVAFAT